MLCSIRKKLPSIVLTQFLCVNDLTNYLNLFVLFCLQEGYVQKKKELWAYIREENPQVYHRLRYGLLGRLLHLPGRTGRSVMIGGYKVCQKIFGFN